MNTSGTVVDLISLSQLRRFVGVNGISVSIYLNLSDVGDPKNYNVEILGLDLQNSINSLTKIVNVNTLDITTLNSTISRGLLARYTKTESDVRYYTKTEIDTDIKIDFMFSMVVVIRF